MPITTLTSDPDALTLTLVGEYPVPVRRLWQAWVDPRQIERFWGPPDWPATFTRHDLRAGGSSNYFMSGPEGEQLSNYTRYIEVVEGERIAAIDGFAGDDGEPNDDMPSMRMDVRFEPTVEGSRFTSVTTFPSLEAMEQLMEMGMMEGLSQAMAQMDDVLADLASFAAGRGTEAKRLTPTRLRVTRMMRGTVEQIWRATREPELIQRWMLGPDGWTMPVCQVPDAAGGTYRYEWESVDRSQRFGFEGTMRELDAPHRQVFDQRQIGAPEESGMEVETTLQPMDDGALLVLVFTTPTAEMLDEIIAGGMADGMELSYARLDRVLDDTA
jgi:uncharacterized protein YndB with AHSA1/START domain